MERNFEKDLKIATVLQLGKPGKEELNKCLMKMWR